MKEYAEKIYKSMAWKKLRDQYLKSVGGLCERCYKKGYVKPAEIVHHKVYISAANVDDPSVTLNMENLEALCRECHEREHRRKTARYELDKMGRVKAEE